MTTGFAAPKTVAVVVTYNRRAKLVTCLKALTGQTVPCEILVVDNASTDGTDKAVSALGLRAVTYLNAGSNLGGAGGFAFGIRRAVEMGADRIWIMDDDVIPKPEALAGLLDADMTLVGDYGWLSSMCLGRDGEICPMNRQRSSPYRKLSDFHGNTVPAQMASFVSLFFPVETVRRFGLPIAEFFIWCDDLEWTRRISRVRPCYVVPSSIAVHDIEGAAASDLATDTPGRVDRYFYAFRNEFYAYRREGTVGFAYYLAKCAKNLLRVLLCGKAPRRRRLVVLFKGVVAGAAFRPTPVMV